ncbi:ABC transporter permease [Lentilactobacillus sp. Marseille-Q4993]|uniref:FtsX-like permease family protein n=1 Tax=Lentilactobacillus sp. Marseille-Q4993 TaxID=3039492 RepID=UPI0024BC34CB|nr:ABC transporter permease [Lentilactobacillus sp. Marseille-Q4993]
MLLKLSLSGIRSRFKDYLVLFSGLIMSSAIFYMFESIAVNKEFVTSTSVGSIARYVFMLGAILLGIITLVYVSYANTFLLTMRKHDYGLFMMLGARPRKIGLLIGLETIMIGMISTVIGIVLGAGITQLISGFMFDTLALPKNNFSAIYGPAILYTLIFFAVLFVLSGFLNNHTFTKSSALDLLKSEQNTDWKQPSKLSLTIQGILGLILLGVGYSVMFRINDLQMVGIGIALVTIVLGTYFLFRSLFVALLDSIQHTAMAQKGLGSFTISQLKFRINDFTKILTVVSLLFALALGAITVGVGFKNLIPQMATANDYYTLAITNPTAKEKQLVNKLDGKTVRTYDIRSGQTGNYLNAAQFEEHPFYYPKRVKDTNKGIQVKVNDKKQSYSYKIRKASITDMNKRGSEANQRLASLFDAKDQAKQMKIVSSSTFAQLGGEKKQIMMVRVKDMAANNTVLNKINTIQQKAAGKMGVVGGAYTMYVLMNGIFGSFEFMGIFLGIAFLAMLASCLMFKILSGTSVDAKRYAMLNKIGTRRSVMKGSIRTQIFGLFALPAILGLIDVVFGLQMFVSAQLLTDPYPVFYVSALVFVILYLVYYAVTVAIYNNFVVPKTKIEK